MTEGAGATAFPVCSFHRWKGTGTMDFIRSMQSRDWAIAAVAFIVGAIIF